MKYVIGKNGNVIKSEFEMEYEPRAFSDALIDVEKRLKEAEAQKRVYEAKAANVSRNHPHVLKVDEEKRNAIWLFHENFVASKQSDIIIKGLKKSIRGLKSEMSEIEKQTGVKL